MRSRLAATIVAANFSFGIPYAAGRPSAARDDRVSCIQLFSTYLVSSEQSYTIMNNNNCKEWIDQPCRASFQLI